MSDSLPPQDRFFRLACLFEAGLAPLAVLFGWLAGVDPFAGLDWSEPALANGLLATLPLLVVFFALQALEYPALRDIRELLLETLGARLVGRHWSDLLILAGLAGFGEEVLFRGFLQPWLENHWGALPALWLSNTVFALVHAVTPLYAALALLIGLYLGVLLDYGGERNLLMPMVAHAAYDFVAFVVILRDYRNRAPRSQ